MGGCHGTRWRMEASFCLLAFCGWANARLPPFFAAILLAHVVMNIFR